MAQWKPLAFNNKIKDNSDLLGIELLCPDELNIAYGDSLEKERSKKRKLICNKKTQKKKKTSKEKIISEKKEISHFEGFEHYEEMTAWHEFTLREEILAALYDKNFIEPTEIQLRCLGPAVCGFRDILGAAETGSGKTLAFGIPIVNGILNLENNGEHIENSEESDVDEEDWESGPNENGCVKVKNLDDRREKNKLLAVILTPTRELAVQVKNHLNDICKYTKIKIVLVVGGLAQEKQERLLNKRPEIIVATPGRLWDLVQSRHIHLQNINKIRYLAIDETDRMLEKGHFEELNKILETINSNEYNKKKRQNFIFSATLTLVHDPPSYIKDKLKHRITPGAKIQDLVTRIGITNPKVVDITNAQVTPENLKEFKVVCKFEEKDYYLHFFLQSNSGRKIIFCNSIGCVKRLANLLNILEYSPLPLHANMMQKQRLKNLEKFSNKENSILIATDVAARGLDISNVHHVIHYQVPKTAETYVHRSGRTARKKNPGNVLLLIEPQEYKSYLKLMHTLGRSDEMEDITVDTEALSHVKKVIHLTRDIDQLALAFKKKNSTESWYSKAMDEMDILLDEDDLPTKISDAACKKIQRDLSLKRKQLKLLLRKPEVSKNFVKKFISREVPNQLLQNTTMPGAFVLKKRRKCL